MLNLRFPILAAAVALMVPTTAHAAVDASEAVSALAVEAAELVAQEQQLLPLADPGRAASATELAEARARLRAVDLQANSILQQLDRFEADVTLATRTALEPLPPTDGADDARNLVPPPVVYDAAINDLMRLAATPGVPTAGRTDTGSESFGLLLVAAGALVVLGLTALLNALRRTSSDDELAAMAWSDGLTGLANRRRLDHDVATPRPEHGSTAVVMVDVDHFKSVNDRFGHRCGDDILRRVGEMLSVEVRTDDVVYRYGGEEFCILLNGATIKEAELVADRIVQSARRVELPDGTHLTVSVGVADGPTEHVTSTIETADRALYSAKQGGRDQAVSTVGAPDPEPASDTSLTPA